MPLLHCSKCHHEWEGLVGSRCQWCQSIGYILQERTPLEKTLMEWIKSGEWEKDLYKLRLKMLEKNETSKRKRNKDSS